jgi:hypothetical protein
LGFLWRKPGGLSLSLSLALHLILLVIAYFWITGVALPGLGPTEFPFLPKSGGGGTPDLKPSAKKVQGRTLHELGRVAARDTASLTTLPENFPALQAPQPLAFNSGSLSGGLGGSGAGGGKGSGQGKGIGSGSGIGSSLGGGGMNPFGMLEAPESALEGTFFDMNSTATGAFRVMHYPEFHKLVHRFVSGGWDRSQLKPFLEAPRTLYLEKLYLPAGKARRAPAAFGQVPDEKPCWIVLYRGTIIAPKSGKFRFVGAGDDVLVVRFNGANVFDHGYFQGTKPFAPIRPPRFGQKQPEIASDPPPPPDPVTLYQYASTVDWNGNLGGMAAGREFEVVAGQKYPVEILIGESQGGLFAAALLIEEVGATYRKTPQGSPVLPLFRTAPSVPAKLPGDNAPPFDPEGPVWKTTGERTGI